MVNLAKHMLMFILSYKIWNMKKNYIKILKSLSLNDFQLPCINKD